MRKRTVDLSGFGGGYEAMCQTMLWRGINYLAEVKPPLEMWERAKEYRNVYGVFGTEGADLKALEDAIIKPGDDATGAMHHAVMSTLRYIHKHGVEKWLADVEREQPDRIYEADVILDPADSHHGSPGGLMVAVAAAALALLTATSAHAEIACRQNYDGSWESYDTTTGATIAHGGASGCPGRAAPPPPPPPPTSSVPALPTVGWYGRDLWANATGPRGDLTPYECGGIGSGGCKWRSRTICNEGSSRLTVIIPVDGGIGVAQPTSQLNATITVCRGGECHRVGHENIAWPASDWSQHNAVMTAWAWPGDCYVAEFYVGLPERWWEVAE